jgi:hypothetical protein
MSSPNDNIDNIRTGTEVKVRPGVYKAKVVGYLDPTHMGALQVKVERYSGNDEIPGQVITVGYMSPFFGSTSKDHVGKDPNNYEQTQKSYGFWMVPPDVGTTVLVLFANNDIKYGYWIGVVPDEYMNFSVPGIAATKYVVTDTKESESKYVRVPVAEYNKEVSNQENDPTKITKPEHPFAKILQEQGLLQDDIRGITTSSARRETPSMVFGISTPGPVDKKGKKDKVGPVGKQFTVPVSRLGGSTFVMDDGDDKFLRKKPASEGPPEYASVEQKETDGDPKIPHNELIRLRTRTGHQILLHNSEDLIYIGNARGTTWIEMTSNGKIDIYAEDSISVHTKTDLNFRADRDVNIEAGRNMNLKGLAKFHAEGNQVETVATNDTKITSGGASHINSKASHRETAGKIYMNSNPAAASATALKLNQVPNELGETVESIMMRVPSHEPWPHHENLDPQSFLPTKTDREAGGSGATATMYKKYTTLNDTFEKFLPPQPEEGGSNNA